MSLFTKPHLPLISSRIVFQPIKLPARPDISHRLNLDRRIRRADRVRSAAESPRMKPRPNSRVQSRAPTPVVHTDSQMDNLSDLSDLSDLDEEVSAQVDSSTGQQKIPKPAGEPGRSGCGGYNLEDTLGWGDEKYNKMVSWINSKIKTKLNGAQTFSKQEQDIIKALIVEGAQKMNIENMYENDWPIREGFKLRLKSTSDQAKKKQRENSDKAFKTTVLSAAVQQGGIALT